jgi:hypothetical protein
MENLAKQIRDTRFSEYRPRYLLVLCQPSAADTQTLTHSFPVGTYQAEFMVLSPVMFYTYASGLGLVLYRGIEQALGHSDFVLSAIVVN